MYPAVFTLVKNQRKCLLYFSVYWRENLGQATLEKNAKIKKFKNFFFFIIVRLLHKYNSPLSLHLHREVRSKGYLQSSKKSLSALLKGMSTGGVPTAMGQLSSGLDTQIMYLLSLNICKEHKMA